jgi:hypothetical protein
MDIGIGCFPEGPQRDLVLVAQRSPSQLQGSLVRLDRHRIAQVGLQLCDREVQTRRDDRIVAEFLFDPRHHRFENLRIHQRDAAVGQLHAGVVTGPLASQNLIWAIQIGLVLLGLLWALRTTERAHRRLANDWSLPGVSTKTRLWTAAFLLLATVSNLWLLAQPMDMRSGL